MKTIRLVVELINVPDECTAEKFRTKLEEGEFPSCIADNFGIVAANMADKNIEDLDNFQFTIYPFPEDEEDEFDDDELDRVTFSTEKVGVTDCDTENVPYVNAASLWHDLKEEKPPLRKWVMFRYSGGGVNPTALHYGER